MNNDKFVNFDRQAFIDYLKTIDNQYDALMYLYHLVFDDMNNIFKINGYPFINKKTSDYIFMKMIEFDEVNHPNILSGGLWMNSGFSVDDTLPDDVIYYDMDNVTLKGENDLTQIIVDNISGYLHIGFIRKGNYHSYFITPLSWRRLKPFLKNMTFEKRNHFIFTIRKENLQCQKNTG